ncbi:MAG: hypothetical protein DMF59_19015 [Acidobacteria bacterium]|nr:MAG: hypothetical protein DMF59_19015 [Acidobacteriota bacterium]
MISGRRMFRRNLPHYQSDFRTYFVTFATASRWILPPIARDLTMRHIVFDHGAVCIFMRRLSCRTMCYSLSLVLKGLKGSSARSINKALHRNGSVWQHESFDHELRRDEDCRLKSEYICANPVRKGLVSNRDDYRWIWREWIEGAT